VYVVALKYHMGGLRLLASILDECVKAGLAALARCFRSASGILQRPSDTEDLEWRTRTVFVRAWLAQCLACMEAPDQSVA